VCCAALHLSNEEILYVFPYTVVRIDATLCMPHACRMHEAYTMLPAGVV
jgi:hypothetical protein